MGQLTDEARDRIRQTLLDPVTWSHTWIPERKLRTYQTGPVRSVAESVHHRDGKHHVWYFSRQSGKDEAVAQLIAYLLTRYQDAGGSIVLVAPTEDPQARISRDRTIERLRDAPPTRRLVRLRDDTVHVKRASARFLSIEGNIRGQTASLLLIGNEAQDLTVERWDPVVAPFTASTNAPTLIVGTAWKADSLIGRERRAAARAQERDRQRRLWLVDWRQVAAEVEAYGNHVAERMAQLGPDHPFIRSEYFLEELDEGERLFGAARLAQLEGSHQRIRRPIDSEAYAGLVDVAGSDELTYDPQLVSATPQGKRDSTVLTVVRVISEGVRPRYETVDRRVWINRPASQLHDELADLARLWKLRAMVIDNTGIGHGLASFMARTIGKHTIVEPFTFTAKSKSDLGWSLISMIDTGRIKEYQRDRETETAQLYDQLSMIDHEILPGPQRTLRWSVPATKGHDDLVMSLALIAHLDTIDLTPRIARGS